jgi:hypothetical protein
VRRKEQPKVRRGNWQTPDATIVTDMASRVPISTSGEAARKLLALKDRFFTPATRASRIARSRAALDAPSKLHLRPEEWKAAAESPEFEEES